MRIFIVHVFIYYQYEHGLCRKKIFHIDVVIFVFQITINLVDTFLPLTFNPPPISTKQKHLEGECPLIVRVNAYSER